jgi:hypothetical protein
MLRVFEFGGSRQEGACFGGQTRLNRFSLGPGVVGGAGAVLFVGRYARITARMANPAISQREAPDASPDGAGRPGAGGRGAGTKCSTHPRLRCGC